MLALTWRVSMRCTTSRKEFVSGKQWHWLVGKWQHQFECNETPNNNKHRTTMSSNWWHGAASLVSTSARCCNMRDKKQKENSHHLFYSCSIYFFHYEQSCSAPSVGQQARKNSGSGIASHICVGSSSHGVRKKLKFNNSHVQHWNGHGHLPLWDAQHPALAFQSPSDVQWMPWDALNHHQLCCVSHCLSLQWCHAKTFLMPRVAMTALSHMWCVYCITVCPWQQEKLVCVMRALSSIRQMSWWHQAVPATWYSVFCPQSASSLLQCSCASIGYCHTARQWQNKVTTIG